ncbi:MAG: mechanosensitive ion channel family protein [Bacteroidota bacterium]
MSRNVILFLLITIFSISQTKAQQTDSTEIQQSVNKTYVSKHYVVFQSDSLFSIETNLGPYPPKQRADAISERMEKLAKEYKIVADSFNISELNNYSIISYSDFPIMSISETDAASRETTRKQLATEYMAVIKTAFSEIIEQSTSIFWITRIGYTLITIIGLVLIFFLINKLFKWINTKLLDYEKGLKRKRKSVFRYLAPKGPDYFFLFLSRIVKIVLIVVIIFFYLPLIFSFLPWTKDFVNQFYSVVSEPILADDGILQKLKKFITHNLVYLVIIFFIARYVLRIISYVSAEIENEKLKLKGFHKDWAKPTFNIIKIIVYAFTLVFMFPYLPGSDSPAFQGVSIFLGVLFSLGSTSAIANIVAGIVITYMRPFQIGDRVKIGETIGDIVEKNLLVTRIKTVKNEDVTIPNATIINTHLWNFSKNASKLGIILHPTVTIGYDVPSQQVTDLLLTAAKNTKNLTRDFKPFVLQKGLDDFYVEYELNVYTKQPGKMAHFYSELNKNILNEFNKANVEILSPHYSAYRNGNDSAIPAEEPADTKNPVNKVIDKITGQG